MAGDDITRSEAQQGDASASIGGAIAGGLLGTASVVWSGVTSGGASVTKTVGDVFKDIGDAFGDGDGSDAPPVINYNTFVTKPGDWRELLTGVHGADDLSSYTHRVAKETPTLESGNLQIKSTGVRIDSTTATPDTGYKLQVEGDTKIKNGTSKYFDGANNKVGIRVDADLIDLGCDIKLVGDTCVDGDLKVTGVLKNGADKSYILQEDHDDDITTITDILTDITDAIPTDENGNNEIPANETLAYNSQITGLQTQVDNLNYPTIENVDNLIDARLQSVGVVDDNLALLHYDKTEVDALVPDVSEYETTTQLDTRLADYTTISLFEAHENLMELELAGKADTTAIPDVSNFITSADLPDTTGFALSSAIPDISSFITNSTNSLANYDTSTEVDTKLASVGGGGGGGVWEEGSGGDVYYTGGYIGIGTNNPHVSLHIVGGAVGTSSNPTLGIGTINYINYSGDADRVYRTLNFNHSQYGSYQTTTSFYCTNDLWCGETIGSFSGTISASDRRIKKEIVDIEDGLALERLRLLKPKQYQYVDEFKRGTEPVWGFIAQEVRETLPYATKLRTECLPNIYEVANVSASNVITLTNFDTSTLESNAMVLKVYDTENKEHLVNIAEVIDGHSVRINEDLTEWTEDDKIFVYGQQVQDFVMLQKEAIFTIATSALQEVDRQLQAEKDKVASLEARISALEKK